MKNNFSRSNVNESTLQVTQPYRSSFNLSHNINGTFALGQFMPVNIERLLPSDVVQGSLAPKLQLERIITPTIGRVRLDTHTFQVNMRRIHTGYRQFLESNDNKQVLPSIDVRALAAKYFAYIHGLDYSTIYNYTFWTALTHASGFSDSLVTLISAGISNLNTLIASSSDLGFTKDFLAIQRNRLAQYKDNYESQGDNLYIDYFDYVLYVIDPLFGAGSQLDFLGYPIYTKFGSWYQSILAIRNQHDDYYSSGDPEVEFRDGFLDSVSYIHMFSIVFCNNLRSDVEYDPSNIVYDNTQLSEMPLRAVYACYYDYMRDWHVEPRTKVLDPDTFGSVSLLAGGVSAESFLPICIQLLGAKQRYYARDFLTTIQTDDIYRHVYAPVFGQGADSSLIGGNATDVADTKGTPIVDNLISLTASEDIPFLSDLFTSTTPGSGNTINAFKADLQTMRRTGMLEKWLARNYFFPDTYAGQLRAHYDVEPDDINVLISQYLGGNEQFISGDQQIAATGTDDTPAGSRTLVAGVDMSDNFSYRASDHCYLISFVSLVPLVNYDVANSHLQELRKMDIATPEFAQDSRVAVRTRDLLRGFENSNAVVGYVPRYYGYRVHGDETHGRYLTDLRSYAWFRDWYNMNFAAKDNSDHNYSTYLQARDFSLDPYSLRIHLDPDAFAGLTMTDAIAFGSIDVQLYINRALPAAVDVI